MKKIFCVLLLSVFVLSSCGNGNMKGKKNNSSSSSSSSSTSSSSGGAEETTTTTPPTTTSTGDFVNEDVEIETATEFEGDVNVVK